MQSVFDEFTIQLVLYDIGGSNISKKTIKTFERFLRCIHRFDEDVLNLGDIKIQNEEDMHTCTYVSCSVVSDSL